MPGREISVEHLGRITLLQSMAALLPDQISVMRMIGRGLQELPGISSVRFELATGMPDKKFEPVEESEIELPIIYRDAKFGFFAMSIDDREYFDTYQPYLENFMNMLGVIFAEKQQRDENLQLTRRLEEMVRERTRQLEESSENLRITLDSIGDGIIATDSDGMVVNLNPVAERLTGWSLCEAFGRPLSEVFLITSAITGRVVDNPVSIVLERGEIIGLANHTVLTSRNGCRYQIADSAAPIRRKDGEIIGVVLVFRDVTEEYRMQKDLADSEAKYRRLVEGLGPRHCFFATSNDGEFVFLSKNFNHIFGFSRRSGEAKSWMELDLTEKSREKMNDAYRQIAENGEFAIVEVETCLVDGQGKNIEIYAGGVYEDGLLVGIEGICTDITDEIKAERALMRAQMLETIGTLAGGIAHDFNNLLGGLFGFVDLARSVSSEVPVKDYLNRAMEAMERARGLTRQLLTFSKGGTPVKKVQSLTPFIQDTTRFALSGSMVSCDFDVPENLWHCDFDRTQIAQVIDNLVINAKKAMPAGGMIEVSAQNLLFEDKSHAILPPGPFVKISVKDEGVGIAKEHLDRIFDPFFSTRVEGHGLGLAVCYSIVKHHGGCIEVDSTPGAGSIFHFFLPAITMAKPDEGVKPQKLAKGSGVVLLLDDDEGVRKSTQAMLQKLGYSVIAVEFGKEAIERYLAARETAEPVSAMILDLTVPGGMGGKEVAAEIRRFDTELPIFVSSGYAEDPAIADPARYGFTASISKPFLMKQLAELLASHMTKGNPG